MFSKIVFLVLIKSVCKVHIHKNIVQSFNEGNWEYKHTFSSTLQLW